ncbi:MAG: GGDEF domain-containing protein [Proteobacteria bacterium]|nr:GGDEF domain-containing protein [Pseudomonadota bacterium]
MKDQQDQSFSKVNDSSEKAASESNRSFSNPLEFLQYAQFQISESESYKGILKQFVQILGEYFGLTHVVYFLDIEDKAEGDPRKGGIRFPPAKVVDEEQLSKIRIAIKSALKLDAESYQGLNIINIGPTDYCYVVFADPSGLDGFLVWKQPSLSIKTPVIRQMRDNTANSQSMIDFISRSTQHACKWFRKLDKTQALLYQDEVTGLYNYRYLDVALDGELKRLQRFHAPFSLLFIDLDNFKAINDSHGHMTGSSVLKQVGDVIKLAVRDVDNVIRFGGDEFVVVLIGANSRQALQAAERVRSRVQNTTFKTDTKEPLSLTASIGVASCPEHGRDKNAILKMADETMYQSKKNGKNRVMMVQVNAVETSANATKDIKV